MELTLGYEGPSIEDLRWHGLAVWKVPEVVPVEPRRKRVVKPKPVGVRVRINAGCTLLKPPYDFSWHPVPSAEEMREMFGTE